MMNKIRYLFHYLNYLLLARHKNGHGIHSPFVFSLIQEVFRKKIGDEVIFKIELTRKNLIRDKKIINLKGFGAGSHYNKLNNKKLKHIVGQTAINKKYGFLLYRITKYFKPKNIIELGTSTGISTLYLASGNSDSKIYSIEGEKELCEIARINMEEHNLKNVEIIEGNFDSTFQNILNNEDGSMLIYIDGNHTKINTLNYFSQVKDKKRNDTILIIDDIYWSKEMQEAWRMIKKDEEVFLTIDIFKMGMVFFDNIIVKQNFIIKF